MLRVRDGGGWFETPGERWEADRGIDSSSGPLGCPRRLFEHWLIHRGVAPDGGNKCYHARMWVGTR